MRITVFVIFAGVMLAACDKSRVYEKNYDFDNRLWLVNNTPSFEFEISDTTLRYNLYCDLRNTVSFPYSRLFINYSLQDSTGLPLQKRLIETLLFDRSTGKPEGSSGLGDIYDQQIPLDKQFRFPRAGKYSVKFQQYMRTDSLEGVLAVGLRIEKAEPAKR
jgi:gliding motility-associated lipoprotein GldH